MAETAPSDISIAHLNFASLSSPSSLANSCTFLVSVWRLIKDLAWSALATVPGRKRRVLLLAWLKNWRIFSLRFLCLSYNTHDSSGIFCSRKWKTWNSCRIPRLVDVEKIPPKAPYIEDKIWGSSSRTKLKEGMSSKINFSQFPREPSTTKSAPLHKGAIEYAFRIPKRSAPSHKSINDSAPHTPKPQERTLGRRRGSDAHRGTRLNRPWHRPENIKILLPVRGAGHYDFEGLLWGQRI